MPIIYVHGVNTRNPSHFTPIREYLRRIVAPAIAPDPDNVSIRAADWFSLCEAPKWNGISRPRTILLAAGATEAQRIEVVDSIVAAMPLTIGPSSGFTSGQSVTSIQKARIDGLPDEKLADLIAVALRRPPAESEIETDVDALLRARIGIAADQVARDFDIRRRLVGASNLDAQLQIVANAVQEKVEQQSSLAAQGGAGDFFRRLRDRVTESVSRTISRPAAGVTILASEIRPSLNDFVTRFLGDVLFYVTRRGTPEAPGQIPSILIEELETAWVNKESRGGEPIVLLTHSMGGQIAYDTLTSFLPAKRSPVKVDYWCATASQVGFFEELNMFLASSKRYSRATGKRTPVNSSNLRHWWNVWDHNDILSFTTKGIFADGIDDEEFWTGMSVAAAHGGYLERPSFYRRFAEKLTATVSAEEGR